MAKKTNTIASLTAAYNDAAEQLGRKTVKSFKNLATAERRTKEILQDLAKAGKAGKKAAKGKREPRERNPLAFLDKDINLPREGSMPHVILTALTAKGGATMDELEALVAQRDKELGQEPVNLFSRVQRWMRHLHFYNSLALEMKGDRIVGTLPQ